MASATENVQTVKTGLQFVSEAVIPGGSNLVNGDLKQAAIHAVLGIIAGSVFGIPGALLIAANSFTRATNGHHLYEALNIGEAAPTKK